MKSSSIPSRSIMARLGLWHRQRQAKKQLVEHVVKSVDPKIRLARGYQKKLEQPIQTCLEHCQAMVANIPGPIHLNPTDYDADPLIHAAFIGSEGIENLLLKQDTTLISPIPSEPCWYALLTMKHKETTIFGPKVLGDMVLSDAPMQAVTFNDHKIVTLSPTLKAVRDTLEEVCFHLILEAISREIAAKRTNLNELRAHLERLRGLSKMFSDENNAQSNFGYSSDNASEKLKKVEQMLQESGDEFVHAKEGNATPEDWLTVLIDHLNISEKIMQIEPFEMRLDWKNVLTDDPKEKASILTLAQCSLADKTRWDAVLICHAMKR